MVERIEGLAIGATAGSIVDAVVTAAGYVRLALTWAVIAALVVGWLAFWGLNAWLNLVHEGLVAGVYAFAVMNGPVLGLVAWDLNERFDVVDTPWLGRE